MDTGMLWFDDSDRPLTEKITTAVSYYEQKYERAPNLCAVHPSMLPDGETSVGPVDVRIATAVMPHHFWLGIDDRSRVAHSERRKAA